MRNSKAYYIVNLASSVIVFAIITYFLIIYVINLPLIEHNSNIFFARDGILDLIIISTVGSGFYGLVIGWIIFANKKFIDCKISYENKILYQEPSDYKKTLPNKYFSDRLSSPSYNNQQSLQSIKLQCFYKAKYYDFNQKVLKDYCCDEYAFFEGYCRYHQPKRSVANSEQELDTNLNEKINRLVEDRQEVFCIGYQIGFLSLRGKKLYKPLYFHGVRVGLADFRDVCFMSEDAIPYFVDTYFKEVSFENAEFNGEFLFISSEVQQTGIPSSYFANWGGVDSDRSYSSLAIFKNTKFNKKAIFYGSKLYGIICFDNAVFKANVDFRFCKFKVEKRGMMWNNAVFLGEILPKKIKLENNSIPAELSG